MFPVIMRNARGSSEWPCVQTESHAANTYLAPPTFIQKRKLLHVNVQMGELLVFFPRNFHLTDLRQTHAQ